MSRKKLLEDIDDLIIQATKERSHFYVKSVLERCKERIKDDELALEKVQNIVLNYALSKIIKE